MEHRCDSFLETQARAEIRERTDQVFEVLVRTPCEKCEGAGEIHMLHCGICKKPLVVDDLVGRYLPCGHYTMDAQHYVECGDCDGQGHTARFVSVEEFARMMTSTGAGVK